MMYLEGKIGYKKRYVCAQCCTIRFRKICWLKLSKCKGERNGLKAAGGGVIKRND